jgi:epoxide hydrolase-like predicted phosphatase
MSYRAVIFDLGGVVVGSPLHAIAAYERDHEIPAGFINRVVVTTAPGGAWSRLERGELTLEEFYPEFEEDCADAGWRLSARALMNCVGAATVPRPQMLAAISRIRAAGLQAAALTNNWIAEEPGTQLLRPHFDVFVESAVVGLRKPDPRIFELTCEQLRVTPTEAVFLDDIGSNLKAARALGMATIKVADPDAALGELEALLGVRLLAARPF